MAPNTVPATGASRWLYVTPFAGQNQYNTAWWRAYWKRLPAEGVIIPADGADLAAAAHTDGLLVLARMDMALLSAADATAHPDWAAVDAQGRPIQFGGRVAACVNRGYFKQEAAQATTRLIRALGADGVLAVGWSGLDRTRICHCPDCARDFRASSGAALPEAVNMDLPAYWTWVDWNVKRRNEIWTALDTASRQAGATAYGWTGLTEADRMTRTQKFQDVRTIAKTASILFIEDSAASAKGRFRLHLDSSRYLTTLLATRPVIALNHTHQVAGREFALTSDAAAEITAADDDGTRRRIRRRSGAQCRSHARSARRGDRSTCHGVAADERRSLGGPLTVWTYRAGMVGFQRGSLWTCRVRSPLRCALPRDGRRALPQSSSLSDNRCAGVDGGSVGLFPADPSECRRDVRRGSGRSQSLCARRRSLDRHQRNKPLRSIGRAPHGFCPRGCLRHT